MHSLLAMLRKEWWENPLVYRLPLFMFGCGAVLFISLISSSTLEQGVFFHISFGGDLSDMQKSLSNNVHLLIAGGAGLLSILLGTQYFPRTLHKERAEGSIMFWRSMPISNVQTHVAKLGFGLLVIPLVCSLLVLASDLMLWFINIYSDYQFEFLYRQTSLGYVLLHWVEFVARMGLVGVLLLPLALSAMAISQKVNSPLVLLLVIIYTLRWMPIGLFGYYGIDDFFTEIFALPLRALIAANPFDEIPKIGWTYIGIYTFLGIFAWTASLKFSRTVS